MADTDSPNLLVSDDTRARGSDQSADRSRNDSVDLHGNDQSLHVDISDALSERERVKFTVHTKTELKEFSGTEFSVNRDHEEFVWLHDRYLENEEFAGIIIPPPPPRPDFDASREKLQKLSEGEGTLTKEEFTKMKQELESEYLATFKKTVAMHEVFLSRLAAHPVLRNDHNLRAFLEYKDDLSVRGKNTKELFKGFGKAFGTKMDEKVLLANKKDVDELFDAEKIYHVEYHNRIKDAVQKCDKMTSSHKRASDNYIKLSTGLSMLSTMEPSSLDAILQKASDSLEKLRKIEARMATDEDLKLGDLLRYHSRETMAAKGLLYRRLRSLANLETANKNLDKARGKNKNIEIQAAEKAQQGASEKFDSLSETAKVELDELKRKRVAHFKKNMIELAELQAKHARSQCNLISATLQDLNSM